MNKSILKQLIKEEITSLLKENWLNRFKSGKADTDTNIEKEIRAYLPPDRMPLNDPPGIINKDEITLARAFIYAKKNSSRTSKPLNNIKDVISLSDFKSSEVITTTFNSLPNKFKIIDRAFNVEYIVTKTGGDSFKLQAIKDGVKEGLEGPIMGVDHKKARSEEEASQLEKQGYQRIDKRKPSFKYRDEKGEYIPLVKKLNEKKKFPDLTGDGKVTKADILKGRGVKLK